MPRAMQHDRKECETLKTSCHQESARISTGGAGSAYAEAPILTLAGSGPGSGDFCRSNSCCAMVLIRRIMWPRGMTTRHPYRLYMI